MNERNFHHAILNTEQTLILAALAALQEKAALQGRLVEPGAPLAGQYELDGTVDLVYENQSTRYSPERRKQRYGMRSRASPSKATGGFPNGWYEAAGTGAVVRTSREHLP